MALTLHYKNKKKNNVRLDQPRLSLGRDDKNQIVIDEEGITGFHAEINNENGRYFLVDLGSTNGSYINNKKITGKQEIKAWDVIKLDTVEIEVIDTNNRKPTTVNQAISDADLSTVPHKGPAGTQVRQAVSDWMMEGESGPLSGKKVPITKNMSVGRESTCDLVLSSNEVSSRHAELNLLNGQLSLTDLDSTNGTFVNDQRITECVLNANDVVKFDTQAFKVIKTDSTLNKTTVRSAAGLAETKSMPSLEGVGVKNVQAIPLLKSAQGKSYFLQGDRNIGREGDNHIVLDDPSISASHARLYKAQTGWFIEDLDSTNGTFVNDQKVTQHVLKADDRVRFGKVEFSFQIPSGGNKSGTQVIEAVGDDDITRTSVTSARTSKFPPWAYGLFGFLVVGVFLALFLFKDNLDFGSPKQIHAELQAVSVWSRRLPTTVTGVSRSNPTTPVIADINGDKILDVVMGDGQGFVLALDGKTGKKIFDVHVKDKILAPLVASDLEDNGTLDIVVATNSGIVKAINGEGKELWSTSRDLNLGAVWNRPVLQDINNDNTPDVIVPTKNKGLVGLDGARGWKLWDTEELGQGPVVTTPAVGDINQDGVVDFIYTTNTQQLIAVSSQNNRVWRLWESKLPANVLFASPVLLNIGKRNLIVALTEVGPVAFFADNGRQAWSVDLPKRFFASPIGVDANGDKIQDVVTVAENGDVYVFDSLTGDEIWSVSLGVDVQASPAAIDIDEDGLADLVVLDKAGRMLVLNMARGRPVLTIQATKSIITQGDKRDGFFASPLIADLTGDGMIEVVTASQEGEITAYGLNRTIRKGQSVWPVFLGNDSHTQE